MKPNRTRRLRPALIAEHGGTAIEMAVILPCLLLLLVGFFDFCIILFSYGNITYATRAAARYASLGSSTSASPCTAASVKAVVTPYLWAATSGNVTVTPNWPTTNTVGATVTVTTRIVYSTGIPWSSLQSVTIQSVAQRTITR